MTGKRRIESMIIENCSPQSCCKPANFVNQLAEGLPDGPKEGIGKPTAITTGLNLQ